MSNEIICKQCGAVMFEYTHYIMMCPNCDNEAYPEVDDPDYPGEIMQKYIADDDYDRIYGARDEEKVIKFEPWEYMNDYENL